MEGYSDGDEERFRLLGQTAIAGPLRLGTVQHN